MACSAFLPNALVRVRLSGLMPVKALQTPKTMPPSLPKTRRQSSPIRTRASTAPTHQTNPLPRSPTPERETKRARRGSPPSQALVQASPSDAILYTEKAMSERLSSLKFSKPVTHVYDPLTYAWKAHEWYVSQFANANIPILLVGMNPGPWGMAQTGVPFGEVQAVRDFLRMPEEIEIGKPPLENSARPITGLSCNRSEVSGRRLWTEWAATHYKSAEHFFQNFFVHNYCPLMFLESGGRNRTPVQLRASERAQIEAICDDALRVVVRAIKPKAVCGVGAYAKDRCLKVLKDDVDHGLIVDTVLHPSPASPLANRGWVPAAIKQLEAVLQSVEEQDFDWRHLDETRQLNA